ncbi:conjugal transfer protein TraV, partial [Escherichia coli]|nr:conjugal transfer protein TraV [Escherichia coli]
QHVIHWLLPSPLTALMSDNTWLWPDSPGTPALTAGDWPVMETDTYPDAETREASYLHAHR